MLIAWASEISVEILEEVVGRMREIQVPAEGMSVKIDISMVTKETDEIGLLAMRNCEKENENTQDVVLSKVDKGAYLDMFRVVGRSAYRCSGWSLRTSLDCNRASRSPMLINLAKGFFLIQRMTLLRCARLHQFANCSVCSVPIQMWS